MQVLLCYLHSNINGEIYIYNNQTKEHWTDSKWGEQHERLLDAETTDTEIFNVVSTIQYAGSYNNSFGSSVDVVMKVMAHIGKQI